MPKGLYSGRMKIINQMRMCMIHICRYFYVPNCMGGLGLENFLSQDHKKARLL